MTRTRPARPDAGRGGARIAAVAAAVLAGCGPGPDTVVVAATTTTYDTGLIDSLTVRFEAAEPRLHLRTIVAGSGQVLEIGRRGDADVLLVHSAAAESLFMAEGHGAARYPLMYNDFVIVGPPSDPARIRGLRDARSAFRRIAASGRPFVSRGDDSGTHAREEQLWREAGVDPPPRLVTGQGQAETLQVASQRDAYTLTDRATLNVLRGLVTLEPLVQGDARLVNTYSIIQPRRARNPEGGARLSAWLRSDEGRRAIAEFGTDAGGFPLFSPLLPEPAPRVGSAK